MGKASKSSRKGKKAWRSNISTDDIDEFYEKQTRDAHAGAAAIPSIPSDSLFFVDKPASASASTSSAANASDPAPKDVPVKRKIEKNREKVLHHESVLKRNPYIQPIPSSLMSKKDKKKFKKHAKKKQLQESREEKSVPMEEDSTETNLDIWGGDAKGATLPKKGMKRLNKNRSTTSVIPAVEVEPQGCSFNPPHEAHQDALALAVADEMRKIYTKELGPTPVPLTVLGQAVAEEDKFFLDAADDGDAAADGDVDAAEGDGDQDADSLTGERKKTKRVTRVELNKRARRKERLRTEADAKKLEVLSKQIDSLPNILEEIAKEDKEKELKHTRRTVAKQERLKSAPHRLGRHKFEPAPVQVLLTEEISGSLRKLKGCCNLARDRYKSIEKRGILAPNKKLSKRPRR
ncbi:ribosome biogenesis protein NOP53 [Hordeum vulgare subsp. vulgare]|uniref:Ribosome biogenesis protein NOP53 n=1 Tax=Hordeum vulgare subsp. vulgare TaxID=112509 RepID=A0A8I6W4L1_HORVV|nr:ribosome biogenesis protein NOP53 [Hordeum vulgare subsp. vulgare]